MINSKGRTPLEQAYVDSARANLPLERVKRYGPKMLAVTGYVLANPGCTKIAAGLYAWGNKGSGNMAFVYGPVNRAIKAGLITAERTSSGWYHLYARGYAL